MNLSFDIEKLTRNGIEVVQRDGRISFERTDNLYVPLFNSESVEKLSREYGAAEIERLLDIRGYEIMKEIFMIELRKYAA